MKRKYFSTFFLIIQDVILKLKKKLYKNQKEIEQN